MAELKLHERWTWPWRLRLGVRPARVMAAKDVAAHRIGDPVFLDTGGLGNAHYVVTPGAKTKLTLTQHPGAHPDDWGYSQDLMFNHVMLCIKQAAVTAT